MKGRVLYEFTLPRFPYFVSSKVTINYREIKEVTITIAK